jgi:hypothetical protein
MLVLRKSGGTKSGTQNQKYVYSHPGYKDFGLCPFEYGLWGWWKEMVYSVKVGTRDVLLGRISDAANGIKSNQRELQ